MDETYKDIRDGVDVRVAGKQSGQPEVLVITSKNGASVDKETVNDITKGTAHAMKAPNGQVTVYAEQSNGKFNQHQMEVHRPHRNAEARQIGETKSDVSKQDVEKHAEQAKSRTAEVKEISSPKDGDKFRQEYLNEQKQKR